MEILNIIELPMVYLICGIVCVFWAFVRDRQDRSMTLPLCFALGFLGLIAGEILGLLINSDVIWKIITMPHFAIFFAIGILVIALVVDAIVYYRSSSSEEDYFDRGEELSVYDKDDKWG